MRSTLLFVALGLVLFSTVAGSASAATTYSVNTTVDPGNGVCNAAECTLREAINAANANVGTDTIDFAIGSVGSSQIINVASALPTVSDAVTIDGWTQGGAGYTGPPLIRIDGAGAPGASGLVLTGGSSLVRGLIVTGFSADGIWLDSSSNVVTGNYVGVGGANGNGVHVGDGSPAITSNRIGTDGNGTNDTAERNVISGNTLDGIFIEGSGAGDVVAGNYIGVSAAGAALGNGKTGIDANKGASGMLIGTDGAGNTAAEGNVISANGLPTSGSGIFIFSSTTASANNNVIAGNKIGTDSGGTTTAGFGNHNGAISIFGTFDVVGTRFPVTGNRIGTNNDGQGDSAEANVIGGTTSGQGIQLFVADSSIVAGNFIGTDATGTLDFGDSNYGVLVSGTANTIGGLAMTQRNVVRFNGSGGVSLQRGGVGNAGGNWVDPTTGNTVRNNSISNNGSSGVNSILTEEAATGAASAPGNGPPDNVILDNLIQNNIGRGMAFAGSSPAIDGNTITGNQGSGIENFDDFFFDNPVNPFSPATAGDDFLSLPTIGTQAANTISDNCTNTGGSPCAGIYSLDTVPSNVATMVAQNGPAANSGFPFVRQDWRGTIETINAGVPTNAQVTLTSSNGGPTYAMNFTSQCPLGVLGGTIIHGVNSNISCTDATTWPRITEYVVSSGGIRTDYTPETAQGVQYSFDGNAATNPTNTGAGFNGEGIMTGPFSRYEVMEVPSPPVAVTIVSLAARRSATGVTLTWRTASEANLVGFNVWRSGKRVNARLIVAKRSGRPAGATYRFVDRLAPRRAAIYRLELVGLNGRGRFVSVRSGS